MELDADMNGGEPRSGQHSQRQQPQNDAGGTGGSSRGEAEDDGDPVWPALQQAERAGNQAAPALRGNRDPEHDGGGNGGDKPEPAMRQDRHGGDVPRLPAWRKGQRAVSLALD